MFEFQLNIMGDNNKTSLDGGSRCSGVAQSLQFASEVLAIGREYRRRSGYDKCRIDCT